MTRGIKRDMRIRVKISVRIPLKRKKLSLDQNWEGYAYFQYERLMLLCFLCRKLGHGESFCTVNMTIEV